MYVAPKSTEVQKAWGSSGTLRGTYSTLDGVSNTTTLANLGSTAHPGAYYAKSLTTGGYNTWYLPARNEMYVLYTNRLATPFATSDSFIGNATYWSSSEVLGNTTLAWNVNLSTGSGGQTSKNSTMYIRAVRRATV